MINIDDYCNKIIKHYGEMAQIDMAIEEMAELIQALQKIKRKQDASYIYNVAEEIADTIITVHQLVLIFDNSAIVDEIIESKLERQMLRMESEK